MSSNGVVDESVMRQRGGGQGIRGIAVSANSPQTICTPMGNLHPVATLKLSHLSDIWSNKLPSWIVYNRFETRYQEEMHLHEQERIRDTGWIDFQFVGCVGWFYWCTGKYGILNLWNFKNYRVQKGLIIIHRPFPRSPHSSAVRRNRPRVFW